MGRWRTNHRVSSVDRCLPSELLNLLSTIRIEPCRLSLKEIVIQGEVHDDHVPFDSHFNVTFFQSLSLFAPKTARNVADCRNQMGLKNFEMVKKTDFENSLQLERNC